MSTSPSAVIDGHPILQRYYAALSGGAQGYQDGKELLPLLAEEFVFEGPIAGPMGGGTRFAHGVRGFIEVQYDAADYLAKGGH